MRLLFEPVLILWGKNENNLSAGQRIVLKYWGIIRQGYAEDEGSGHGKFYAHTLFTGPDHRSRKV